MHDFITVGIPLLVILAGILLNRADSKDLRAEIAKLDAKVDRQGGDLRGEIAKLDAKVDRQGSDLRADIAKQGSDLRADIAKQGSDLRAEMNRQYLELMNRFNSLDRAMNEFYHMTGRLDARMDALEKK